MVRERRARENREVMGKQQKMKSVLEEEWVLRGIEEEESGVI